MHGIALRRIALIPSALLVMWGLTFAPAATPSAAAASNIEICNSGASISTIKVYSAPYFIDVAHGQCGDFLDTTSLRVAFPSCTWWQVRTRGDDYGAKRSCANQNSDPGHLSSYIYKTS